MKIASALRSLTVGVASVALVAGCSGNSEPEDGVEDQLASLRSVSSSTDAAPTSSDPEWPEVTFEACRDIPDEALRSTGLDPSTKDPDASRTTTSTYVACSLLSEPRGSAVNILAMNRTFDSYVEKEAGGDLREYELGGRRAVALRNAGTVANCFVTVETGFGFLTLTRSTMRSDAPREQWCDGIDDMMRVYLQYLPEGA